MLTVEQRQMVIRQALECDDPPLAPEDLALVEARQAAHRQDPGSAIPLAQMKSRLRTQAGQ